MLKTTWGQICRGKLDATIKIEQKMTQFGVGRGYKAVQETPFIDQAYINPNGHSIHFDLGFLAFISILDTVVALIPVTKLVFFLKRISGHGSI